LPSQALNDEYIRHLIREGFAEGGEVSLEELNDKYLPPMSNAELLAQIDRSMANSPAPAYGTASSDPRNSVQTDSRNMLERFTSLNTPQDMSLGETLTDIGMGFAPVVGTAQGLRDFERARRDDDTLGMVLGAASAVPIVGGVVKAARTVGKAAKAGIDLSQIRVRPPSDNITNVRDANFQYPKTIGNQTLDINSITGGVRIDQQEQTRINRLANQISSPEGYISRIIVDQNNNVIEGQHRLEALRQLGAKEVPVYKIEELADTMPVGKMEEAINNAGKIHPDHVNQIMQYALENIAKDGVGNARDYDFGNFQKYYDAALDAIEDGATAGKAPKAADDLAALTAQAPLDMSQASRMQRAAEQGFNTNRPLYHVTNASFDAFEIPENRFRKYGKGVYTSPNLNYVDRYIRENRDIESGYKEGANVMPLYARGNLASEKDWEAARQEMMSEGAAPPGHNRQQEEIQRRLKGKGFDGLNMFGNEIIIFDPSNIRSVNAAFDPAKRGSGNLGYAKGGAVRAYDPLQIENIMSSINAPRNYASGGSVLAYNPGRVDAILNQFRGAV
jgi:hypothetical protein